MFIRKVDSDGCPHMSGDDFLSVLIITFEEGSNKTQWPVIERVKPGLI